MIDSRKLYLVYLTMFRPVKFTSSLIKPPT